MICGFKECKISANFFYATKPVIIRALRDWKKFLKKTLDSICKLSRW